MGHAADFSHAQSKAGFVAVLVVADQLAFPVAKKLRAYSPDRPGLQLHTVGTNPLGQGCSDAFINDRRGNRCLDHGFAVVADPLATHLPFNAEPFAYDATDGLNRSADVS